MRRRVRIQPDDIELLRLLAGPFLLLNHRQIAELFPHRSAEWLRRRLKRLARDGFLGRREPEDPLAESMLEGYYLGHRAVEILSDESRERPLESQVRQARSISDIALPHLRLVTWIQVKFAMAGHHYPDYQLQAWIPQYAPFWGVLNRHGLAVQPDGYARYLKRGLTFHIFIEADRATYRGQHVEKKLRAYARYADSGLARDHFAAPAFRVLFITENTPRREALLDATSRFPPDLFWVTLRTDFLAEPLFAPYWRSAASTAPRSLDEPSSLAGPAPEAAGTYDVLPPPPPH